MRVTITGNMCTARGIVNGLICTVVERISMCIKLRTDGVKEEFEFYLWQQIGTEGS